MMSQLDIDMSNRVYGVHFFVCLDRRAIRMIDTLPKILNSENGIGNIVSSFSCSSVNDDMKLYNFYGTEY